jgi:hypothetical protein
MASIGGVSNLRSLGEFVTKFQQNGCPNTSLWFEWFAKGCLSQMGQVIKEDMAVSVKVMLAMLKILDR